MTALIHHLFGDNPVLGYLNRGAWRRYRRWGWALSILPLTVIGWYLFFQGIHGPYQIRPGLSSFPGEPKDHEQLSCYSRCGSVRD